MDAVQRLRPDIVLGLADYVTHQKSSRLRIEKMGDRTLKWLRMLVEASSASPLEENEGGKKIQDGAVVSPALSTPSMPEIPPSSASTSKPQQPPEEQGLQIPAIFAPILPITMEEQSWYMDELQDEEALLPHISGLVVHDPSMLPDLPEPLRRLPRLSVGGPISIEDLNSATPTTTTTPHDILQGVSLGIDLVATSFVTSATEGGIALSFTFPVSTTSQAKSSSQPESDSNEARPLGIDLHNPEHATSIQPISELCSCHTCKNHHRAYVHHLLTTEEMLAWVLLQVHNLHVFDAFFAGVRASIGKGGDEFEKDRAQFERSYEREMPMRTGKGPRYVSLCLTCFFFHFFPFFL